MKYKKGDYSVEIMMHDPLGKRPGLYVGYGDYLTKVGNFGSDEKAEIFEQYLAYLCGVSDEPKVPGEPGPKKE